MKEQANILIVEHEASVCDTLKGILAQDGYNVESATLGKDALLHLKDSVFNMVVLDVSLPDINSLDLLRALRRSSPFVFVLATAGGGDFERVLAAVEGGAYSYIMKPCNSDEFKVMVKKGIESQKQILVNLKLLEKLKEKKEKTEDILSICEAMSSTNDMGTLVNLIVSEISRFLGAKKASLMLVEEGLQYLVIKAAKGIDEKIVKATKIRIGDGIAGWIAQEGKPWVVTDIEQDSRTRQRNKSSYETKSFMSIPIKLGSKVRGVVNISDRVTEGASSFTEEDLRLSMIIMRQAASALQNCYLNEKIAKIDIKDNITDAFNQKYLNQRLIEEISRVHRYKGCLSVVMLDIDYFKQYNDRAGYMMGNTIIKEFSQIIKENIRGVDTMARYEGGCFVLILPQTDVKSAYAVAEKIRKVISEYPFPESQKQPAGRVTISGGIAELVKGMDKEELISRAYQALLQAKGSGQKNTISIHT
ncbi:MAG: diguanylate cyclase [bacterium]